MIIRKPYLEAIAKVTARIDIERKARQIWEELGRPEGQDEVIWLEAERQILNPLPDTVCGYPIDKSIPFRRMKPTGVEFYEFGGGHLYVDGKGYYFCRYCDGWIEGKEEWESENSLGPLCGRVGNSISCIRCHNELEFWGAIS